MGDNRNRESGPNFFRKGEMILDTFFRATSDTFWEKRYKNGLVTGSKPYIFCECTRCGSPPEKRQVYNIRGNKHSSGDKSCGCLGIELASERQHKPIKKGEVFSRLTAISDTRRVRKEYKDVKAGKPWRYMYELDVRCDCGNEFVTYSQDLRYGNTTRCLDCSCKARVETRSRNHEENLDVIKSGTVLADGNILVLQDSCIRYYTKTLEKQNKRNHCFVGTCLRCSSGKEKVFLVGDVLKGHTESCGCLNRERVRKSQNQAWDYAGYTMYSSWEVAVASEFDRQDIDYEYEPEGFEINGVKYWPDFYLPDYDKYIEVKGFEREVSMEKASEFSKTYDLEIWRIPEVEAFTGLKYWQMPKFYAKCRKETAPPYEPRPPIEFKVVHDGKEYEFDSYIKAHRFFVERNQCNVSLKCFHGRRYNGWTIERALFGEDPRQCKVVYEGKEHVFENLISAYRFFKDKKLVSITWRNLHNRIHRGWKIEEALFTPQLRKSKNSFA